MPDDSLIKTADAAGKRRRRPREELVAKILAAAADEFKRFGFADAKTAAIARNAGVTEAQLFRYFNSKADLFRETIFAPLARDLEVFIERYPPEELAYPYTTYLQKFIQDNVDMFKLLVALQPHGNGEPGDVAPLDSLEAFFERSDARILRSTVDNPPVDPRLMVRVSFASVLACILFKDWIFPAGFASDREITSAVNDFVMNGLNYIKRPELRSVK